MIGEGDLLNIPEWLQRWITAIAAGGAAAITFLFRLLSKQLSIRLKNLEDESHALAKMADKYKAERDLLSQQLAEAHTENAVLKTEIRLMKCTSESQTSEQQ